MHFSFWDLFRIWILGFGILPQSSARPLLLDLVRTSTFGVGIWLGSWPLDLPWELGVGRWMFDVGRSHPPIH